MGGNSGTGGGTGTKRTLQRAGSNANVASTDASDSNESAADRCAANLMAKFRAMGSRAGGKSG